MPSKRVYREKICNNPACKSKFAPHDRRQVYCSRQCGINYNNDKTHNQNKDRFFREKLVRKYDDTLEMLYQSAFYQNDQIDGTILTGCKIDARLATIEQHLDTGKPIYWFHQYGIEVAKNSKTHYTIHHRQNSKSKK